jgi:uncharacterized protein (DUF2147 family)
MNTAILSSLLLVSTGFATAAERTPVGTWNTVNDETHERTAVVEIVDHDGALSGRVTALFPKPGQNPAPLCKDCSGDKKDQPVIGMTIIWNVHRDGDEWNGGEIFDPDGGKTYRCRMHVSDDGQKLEVRGYIGISLLGRTQIWERAASSNP